MMQMNIAMAMVWHSSMMMVMCNRSSVDTNAMDN